MTTADPGAAVAGADGAGAAATDAGEKEAAVVVEDLYGDPDAVTYTWERVNTYHRVEGYVLRALFDRWLPPAPARVADIGAGNGRWALELAARGYRVALADLAEALVADAAARSTGAGLPPAAVRADARRLPWRDDTADAALVLGPLYHLFRLEDRALAIREAARVVRPGGPVMVQSLHRAGALRQVLTIFGHAPGPIDWRWFWSHGTFAEPKAHPFYAGTYWHTPAELAAEVTGAGLTLHALHGLDGPAPEGQSVLADAPDWAVEQWGEVALALGTDPDLLATSNHLLAVATVP